MGAKDTSLFKVSLRRVGWQDVLMGADADVVGRMGPELGLLLPRLDERSRRLVLGAVARAAGDGGITAIAKAAGVSWQTVADGAAELASGDDAGPGRVRRPGGGRKKLEERDPGLAPALRELLEASTGGDPVSLLTWTTLSVRGIAAELTAAGHPCAKNAVLRLLHAEGFSTQENSRTVEEKRHPDRDAQFRYIHDLARRYLAAADPVISVDTKKKELVGLVKSSDLAEVQRGVKAFDRFTLVLPLVTIVLIALSLWLSVNRRRTLLQLAVGVSLLMIVERHVTLHEQSVLASGAHNPQVAQIVLGDLLHGFFVLTAWVLGVALVVLVIAVLNGPYRWAVALRSSVKRTWRGIAGSRGGDHRGVVGWMASHAAGLQLGGAVVAGILLLIVSVSWLGFLIVGVLLAAYEVCLQWIKPPEADEAPPASGPDGQVGLPFHSGETSG